MIKKNEEDCSTEHLIYWKIENSERTVFPRKYELFMLPENSSNDAKDAGIKSEISWSWECLLMNLSIM